MNNSTKVTQRSGHPRQSKNLKVTQTKEYPNRLDLLN